MSTPTQTTAKQAAREDKKDTGAAKLPGTQPVSLRPRLSPEEKAKRVAEQAADQERNLNYRASQVCNLLVEMGSASLAKRILSYDAVDVSLAEAAVQGIRERMAVVEAALAQRRAEGVKTTTPDGKRQKFTLNLQALAAKK